MYVPDVDDFAGPQPSTADPPVDSRLAGYSGTVTIDVDDPMAPTSLAVLSTNAVAATTGDWLPEAGGVAKEIPESTATPIRDCQHPGTTAGCSTWEI